MEKNFSFTSYCWSIGTTSFRVKNLNYKIEKQLILLENFWNQSENNDWNSSAQKKFYGELKKANLAKGNASRPDKDAREKTSGLVNLGVINENRRLTPVGKKILEISKNNSFSSNNIFNINEDSYIYLLQFLKYKIENDLFNIKPFLALVYLLIKHDYLTIDEFTYLLPICITNNKTIDISNKIYSLRNSSLSIDDILLENIWKMKNYSECFEYFNNKQELSNEDFMIIGMNRKSPMYDIPYKNIFDDINNIRNIINNENLDELKISFLSLLDNIDTLSVNIKSHWKKKLLRDKTKSQLIKNLSILKDHLNEINLFTSNKKDLKKIFFETLHLFKWKSTLKDYFDLNRRYFQLTDTLIFTSDKIFLDFFPKYYFKSIDLQNLLFDNINDNDYFRLLNLTEISSNLHIDINKVIQQASRELEININNNNIYILDKIQKEKRLNSLITTQFTVDNLIKILQHIEDREDNKVYNLVTENASIPTIYEYIVAIAWYHISEKTFNLLESLNTKLDSNLLPKSHAIGGNADINIKYDANTEYPKHNLLLEVTLTEDKTQRRAEMEPVSRHLGDFILENPNDISYLIFIAPLVHQQVRNDFRGRKHIPYSKSDKEYINGMKIIPLESKILRKILKEKINYSKLYAVFDEAYQSEDLTINWYKKSIEDVLLN